MVSTWMANLSYREGLPSLPLSLTHLVLFYNVLVDDDDDETPIEILEGSLANVTLKPLNDKVNLKINSTSRFARDHLGVDWSFENLPKFKKARVALEKACFGKGLELRLVDLDSQAQIQVSDMGLLLTQVS